MLNRKVIAQDGVTAQHLSCPECGAGMVLRQTDKFKWKNGKGRLFYGCSRYPSCKGIHGAHPDGSPLGVPANKETRTARHEVHQILDLLTAAKQWSKKEAYSWLAEQFGWTSREEVKKNCHIGKFDLETCKKAQNTLRQELQKVTAEALLSHSEGL